MLEIIERNNGRGNWITANETRPVLLGKEKLEISNDKWRTKGGMAEISTLAAVNNNNLCSVVVGYRYSGKYKGGSQYWRHYVLGDKWYRRTWKELSEGDKMLILDSFDLLPAWVNLPGKLKKDYLKPGELQRLETDEQGSIFGYKYLVFTDGNYKSPRGDIWVSRELSSDIEPTEDNSNGIYLMKSRKSPILLDYRGVNRYLVRVVVSGTIVEANDGMRVSHAQIIDVIK